MPDSIKNQYQNFTQADMSKLKSSGIKAEFRSLEDSIKDYIENHLSK
jgi:ADP-L-glycero-D-manno-heptose 6-epimerase